MTLPKVVLFSLRTFWYVYLGTFGQNLKRCAIRCHLSTMTVSLWHNGCATRYH